MPETIDYPKSTRFVWLEEYHCGCTNVTATKAEALGYCPKHGEDKRRLMKLPGPLELGYAR